MWNELHGLDRAALQDETADLYVAGHHHNAAVKQLELPDGTWTTLMRVRGYKWMDDHSHRFGFNQKRQGASGVTVFNPQATSPTERIMPFLDPEHGADYLTWLRQRG